MISNGLATTLGNVGYASSLGKTARSAASNLGQNNIQKLLLATLQQSPAARNNSLVPASPGTQNLDAGFNDVLLLQTLNNGANLIGKTITYEKAGSSIPAKGKVDGISVHEGKLCLLVGGNLVPLSQVQGIMAHASS